MNHYSKFSFYVLYIVAIITALILLIPPDECAAKTGLDLNHAIELALLHNTQLIIARNELEKAKLLLKQEKINNLPKATLQGQEGYKWNPDREIQNSQLTLEQTLPTSFHLYGEDTATATEIARWDRSSSEKDYLIRRANVIYDTTILYTDALKARKSLEYQESALKHARAAAEFAKEQLKLGKIIKTTQLSVENDLVKAEFELEKRKQDYSLALKRLANQIGGVSWQSIDLNRELPKNTISNVEMEKLIESAIHKRLEIEKSQITVKKAEQSLAEAKNQSLPFLKLGYQNRGELQNYKINYNLLDGELSWTAALQAEEIYKDKASSTNDLFGSTQKNITLTVSLNLDFGLAKNRIQQAEYTLESSKLDLHQTVQDIALEIDATLFDYQSAAARLAIAEKTAPLYKKAFELKQLQWELGLATSLELSGAELELANALLEVENAGYDLWVAVAKLKSALGELYY